MTWADPAPEIPTACPTCEPALDPAGYAVWFCSTHAPDTTGTADALAAAYVGREYLSGAAEAGGEDNRRACAFFHRNRP